ncbi:TetR/AcrR family transcriptional regulator [Fulvivirgaceae bacterium PWU4]|uniref:TetR/AcrR family transcriptional regulator n=1 Tax=Chryseosolibacter histidini TaxID=2782349 RepID=A0AAP2DI30_9BACT|nr:TetR/AcrR family transcriptional regulator [Chryseosolibacter histidini]MBT1696766.1 TetR/AcrR family transcriptional regulator [Chryseosolibacter histidini]
MSLRKEKAARLKVQVLEHTLKLIGKKAFDDIYVEDICEKVKISKVTFFKYFPQKEDVLLYHFRIWCLGRSVELKQKPKEGMQGVYFLLDKLSEECENHPGLMLSLIGYLSDFKRPPKPFPVKPEEKKLLFPDIEDVSGIEILSLDQMLEKFTLDAIMKKEITKTSSTRDITNLFNTIFLGSIVTAHLAQQSPLKLFFRRNLDNLMKGLG